MEYKVKATTTTTTSTTTPSSSSSIPIRVPTMLSHSPPLSSSSPPSSLTFPSSSHSASPNNSSPAPLAAPIPPQSPPPPVVVSPCAACKILRRRCVEKCVLAPYFPPTDPLKFTIAHRVFGASNIIKFLQELPECQRADAVSSMVYEANARIRDPVYGCAGAICQLQKQVSELQGQLAKAQAELVNMNCQQANLVALICMEMKMTSHHQSSPSSSSSSQDLMTMMINHHQPQPHLDMSCFIDDNNLPSAWEPLWT